eukprot:7527453-Lingulodinium_polyedra.AAC.1
MSSTHCHSLRGVLASLSIARTMALSPGKSAEAPKRHLRHGHLPGSCAVLAGRQRGPRQGTRPPAT